MAITKTAVTATTITFALLFGGGAYMMMNLNSLTKPVIERIATQALGVEVSIAAMDIRLQEKSVSAARIKIGNPPGYSNAPAITIESVGVELDTVIKGLITFENIAVNGTDINLEVKESGSNLTTIQKSIKSPKKAPSKNLTKVIIKRFAMGKATLNPSITLLEKQDLAPVEIPEMILTNIGNKKNAITGQQNGILAQDAIAQIMQRIVKNANKTANEEGFYKGISSDALKEIGLKQTGGLKEDIDKLGKNIKQMFE